VRAGRLNRRVTFQRAVVTQNDFGEPVNGWSNITIAWTQIEPLAGKERFSAMQQQADVDHLLTCRYQSELSTLQPEDRAVWNSKIFDIKSVINTREGNFRLEILTKRHILNAAPPLAAPANALYDVDGNPLQFVDGSYIETVD
jgi:SPP1 family predicted phage head-tail adaptor